MPYQLLAQSYKLLEPTVTCLNPSFCLTSVSANSFVKYLQSLYFAIFGITIALSILMFTIGGLRYILSDTTITNKQSSKEMMVNAVFGLLIALASYMILNTINPDLVSLKALTTILNGTN